MLSHAQFAEQIARVEKGDADEAAQALIKAIPNGETFGAYYVQVLAAARSASGKIDVDPLKAMSKFGSDALRELEETRDRRTAILWWASLKLWEMPKGDPKQLLVDRFLADLDTLAEEQRIPPESAVKVAWGTVFRSQIGQDVLLDSLVRLLKRHADSPSPDTKKFVWEKLFELLGHLEPAAKDGLFRFMKAHGLPSHWDSPDEMLRLAGNPFSGGISRKEYDELPTLTLQQLYDKLKKKGRYCGDGTRCQHFFCHYALEHIVGSYRENPEQVMEMVKSLLDDGLYVYLIEGCVKNPPPRQTPADPEVVAEYKPLIDLVVNHPRLMQWHQTGRGR